MLTSAQAPPTTPAAPNTLGQELRVTAGAFDRDNRRNWSKWQANSRFPVGNGSALVTVSRPDYEGERDHTEADFRNCCTRSTSEMEAAAPVPTLGPTPQPPLAALRESSYMAS